jgi:syntaxin 5
LINLTVARKKSLFDDRPDEIQRLTLVIKQDINALNRQIGQLQQVGVLLVGQ